MKITLKTSVLLLVVYGLLRVGFYLANRAYFEDVPGAEVALAFLYGLRFDVAGLILLNAPVLFLYNLPVPPVKPRWYLWMVFFLFALLNTAGALVNVFDFEYYGSVQRRTIFEPLASPRYMAVNIGSWAKEYPALLAGACGGVLVLLVLFAWFLRRLQRRHEDMPGAVRSWVCGVLVYGLAVLGARGGWQGEVMRPADAFAHSPSYAVGNMTLNSTYTVIVGAVLPRYPTVRAMDDREAFRIAARMVMEPSEHLIDPRYPFLRQRTPGQEHVPLNVCVFILESWTAAAMRGPGGQSLTPFYDELAESGAVFTNFLATGQRSKAAVSSIVASVPDLFNRPVIGSAAELTRFRGLGDILDPLGYEVSFHFGASRGIEGFDGFTGMVGFDRYYGREDFRGEENENTSDGTWGIYDEHWYMDAARRMDDRKGPFAAVVFGLAPHDPYRLPPDREALIGTIDDETPYQRMLRYSDYALRRFFDYARTRPWFNNTVFLVTGDHTRFSPPDSFYESFHVPFLIYAPGRVLPMVRDDLASHVDILPTILDLLRVRTRHASVGRSVFFQEETRYCVVQRGRRYVIFDDDFAFMHDLRSPLGLFDYRQDLKFRRDLTEQKPEIARELERKLLAYVQAVSTAVAEDRIWPPDAR